MAGHGEDDDDVEHRHQAYTHVAQVPDEGIGRQAADEQHDQCQDFIGCLGEPVVAKEIRYIGAGVEQDTDEGGEAEQPQDQGDEDRAELAQMVLHGGLQQVHTAQAVDIFPGRDQHDESCAAANDDGVDKHAEGL